MSASTAQTGADFHSVLKESSSRKNDRFSLLDQKKLNDARRVSDSDMLGKNNQGNKRFELLDEPIGGKIYKTQEEDSEQQNEKIVILEKKNFPEDTNQRQQHDTKPKKDHDSDFDSKEKSMNKNSANRLSDCTDNKTSAIIFSNRNSRTNNQNKTYELDKTGMVNNIYKNKDENTSSEKGTIGKVWMTYVQNVEFKKNTSSENPNLH